jgi:hypothetical protein
MKMYKRVSQHKRTCDLGHEHLVGVYATSEWTLTDETFDHDIGYCILPGHVWVNSEGQRCLEYPTVDYPSYKVEGEPGFWSGRPQRKAGETICVDVHEKVIIL